MWSPWCKRCEAQIYLFLNPYSLSIFSFRNPNFSSIWWWLRSTSFYISNCLPMRHVSTHPHSFASLYSFLYLFILFWCVMCYCSNCIVHLKNCLENFSLQLQLNQMTLRKYRNSLMLPSTPGIVIEVYCSKVSHNCLLIFQGVFAGLPTHVCDDSFSSSPLWLIFIFYSTLSISFIFPQASDSCVNSVYCNFLSCKLYNSVVVFSCRCVTLPWIVNLQN